MIEELNQKIEENSKEMINALAELVKIPSVYGEPKEGAPYGEKSRRALQFAMDLGKKLGFETVENVGDKVCYVEYGTGSRVVGVFAHLDIVPEGEGWTYPPFGGEIHNNRIYGRGVVDNKGPFIASLYALYAIKELGLDLGDCRIRVVGGTNEERGMDDMRYYVEQCGAPDAGFTPDGLYPMSFTERGINYYFMSYEFKEPSVSKTKVISLKGGEILNMVPDRASAVLETSDEEEADRVMKAVSHYRESTGRNVTATRDGLRIMLDSKGLCAHSCTPFNGKNAIVAILMLLAELGIDGSLGKFLTFFKEKIGMTTDGSLLGMKREDECGKLTFSLSKMDLNENGLKWVVNIRLPYTYKDQVTDDFKAQVEPVGIVIDDMDIHRTYRFPMDHPLILTLRKVYEELTGKDSTPSYEGGTYAQAVPNIVPFGSIFPGTPDLCHRPDESVDLDEYVLDAKLFGNAMYALTKAD
ncbi:MAG TPA: Sapep family Mn(2+)-dependent dipeptidase [Candidatus Enterocloster excrementigallinarum]|uniref:Sapep family Mn(2+)-dependent dipeptidase n=1 Tax=Candidatus Enterocloster excrementigallinarum TaxID=2838558 RepID=A0A9D2PSE0_9FIRM|nr:Sapep family Mn(2+)-dependent dipeptidase [Candidatus Enterocloster excrementigallinarum]